MTNATKTLAIIFLSLLAITALIKWTGDRSASEAFSSTLVEVDTAAVDRIVIERPAENPAFVLTREEGGWQISEEGSQSRYEANRSAVRRALEQLLNLDVEAVATRSPEKYTRYKADSTGTEVSLFDGENLLAGIIVGAPKVVSRREFNNYVRPVGEQAVYTVKGFLNPTFNRNMDDWRNKRVWQLDGITGIDFQFPADSSYSLKRVDENRWVSRGDTLEQTAVSTMVNRLGSLSAGGFSDSLSVEEFGTEQYAVHLKLEDGTQKQLRIKPSPDNDSEFLAVADNYPYVFTLNKSSWKNSVLKSRAELVKE